MTAPSFDAQSPRFPRQQSAQSPTHSTAATPQSFPLSAPMQPSPSSGLPTTPPVFPPSAPVPPYSFPAASAHSMPVGQQGMRPMDPTNVDPVHEHALDFATHSWDLATGGLKTLTAKREFPPRSDRRPFGVLSEDATTTRNYIFALIVMVCILLMLIGGGLVLFVMLQP